MNHQDIPFDAPRLNAQLKPVRIDDSDYRHLPWQTEELARRQSKRIAGAITVVTSISFFAYVAYLVFA
mgnify:CR=1 FL=1